MIRPVKDFGKANALASRLKERIVIEAAQETSDAQGGVTREWEELAECFAEVTPIYTGAVEKLDAERPATRMQYRVVIRTRDDVTTEMRILWNDKVLNVRAVVALPAQLEIIAEEGVAV